MITIRDATQSDVHQLCAMMRPKDEHEVLAVNGECNAHLLWQKMRGALVALDEQGRVICLFGCTPIPGIEGAAAPWMLGTDRLDKHGLSVCKVGKKYVDAWSKQYPVLTNATLADNELVIKWLKWLGFTFSHTFYGTYDTDTPFIQFSKVRQCANPSPSRCWQ